MARGQMICLVVVLLAGRGFARPPKVLPQPDPDRVTLARAHIQTDDASLLNFFRQRTLTPDHAATLRLLVRQLGDRSFRKREQATAGLKAAGRAALSLVAPAMHDPDPEIAWRAQQCVRAIDSEAEIERILAVARLLARRKPGGAAEVVLAYLPFAQDERVEEELTQTVAAVAWSGDRAKPVVLRALTDAQPAKRAVAVQVLGNSKNPKLR